MPRAALVIGALLIPAMTGCGYTTERPFDPSIKSVHVEMFQTQDFRRDLEFKLSEAVIKRIEMDTDYRIAPRKQADTVLSGELIEVRQNTLGDVFRTDLPRETAVTFVVSFRWKDQRTGRIIAQRERLPYTTTYIPPVGESFFDAAVRGFDGLAELLVESMESPW